MDEATWLASTDPGAMLAWLPEPHICAIHPRGMVSRRKLVLLADAVRALGFCHSPNPASIRHLVNCVHDHDRPNRKFKPAFCDLIRCIIGNPFRPVERLYTGVSGCPPCADCGVSHPATAFIDDPVAGTVHVYRPVEVTPWLTPTVLAIAQAIYEERRFDEVGVLADALEDAGCTEEAILSHLRGPGPHARGCHVLDLLLGKE